MDDLSKQEEQAFRYVLEGEKDTALNLLLDLVIKHANKKNFAKAEELRGKIYDIDSMALSQIIKANEAIEEAKSGSIDEAHLNIWEELNRTLTKEEENALYFALQPMDCPADTVIFQQGQENSSLYFINGGKLNILYRQGDRELFIKKMGTGDIAGDDTFFTASLCTTTLVAISNVKIKFLDRSVLKQWQKDLPALESKIHDFCLRSETASDLLQKKSINRRRQQRVPITGTILIQLVNAAGQALGKVLMGDLSDISVGGVSFLIKARQKETARLLLGKKMNVKISHSTHEINENGTVIGVRYNPQEFRQDTDYSVHMKFDKPLDSQTIWEIENTRRKS